MWDIYISVLTKTFAISSRKMLHRPGSLPQNIKHGVKHGITGPTRDTTTRHMRWVRRRLIGSQESGANSQKLVEGPNSNHTLADLAETTGITNLHLAALIKAQYSPNPHQATLVETNVRSEMPTCKKHVWANRLPPAVYQRDCLCHLNIAHFSYWRWRPHPSNLQDSPTNSLPV